MSFDTGSWNFVFDKHPTFVKELLYTGKTITSRTQECDSSFQFDGDGYYTVYETVCLNYYTEIDRKHTCIMSHVRFPR
jgi:hypothetical protein